MSGSQQTQFLNLVCAVAATFPGAVLTLTAAATIGCTMARFGGGAAAGDYVLQISGEGGVPDSNFILIGSRLSTANVTRYSIDIVGSGAAFQGVTDANINKRIRIMLTDVPAFTDPTNLSLAFARIPSVG